MNAELDLSVPKLGAGKGHSRRRFPLLLLVVLLVSIVNLAVVWKVPGTRNRNKPSPEAGKELALKLEKLDLNEQAVEAWKEYLAASDADNEQCARIWYRIGTLLQDAGDFAGALDGYCRSEHSATVTELSSEIGRRTQECLERLGKFAALRYELAERVGLDAGGPAAGDEVVAEIGPQKITRSELDRRIEADIERQLAQLAAFLPEEELRKQKESILKQRSTTSERMRFLNQFVLEEILHRKARESKLMDDPDVSALLRSAERGLLAQKVIERELKSGIRITENDLRAYYEANKKNYLRPERARISHILLADDRTAEKTLDRIKAGEEFGALAGELSTDGSTREKGGEIQDWIEKGGQIPGIGYAADAQALIFGTEPGETATNYFKTARGYHVIKIREKQPESQKPFEEVRTDVFRALRAGKEREIQEALLARLQHQYDVVIHQSAFAEQKRADEEGQE